MADCATNFTLSCVNSGVDPGPVGGPLGPGAGSAPAPFLPGVSPDVIGGGGAAPGLPVRPRGSSY
jgi:hypothetical protein